MTQVPDIKLNDGNTIPQLGFGVFQIDPAETASAVEQAFRVGYRHIDTAEGYQNEAGVGEGFRASGLARDEVFITSKLDNSKHEPDDARAAMDETLSQLGLDHVDLFLIHWPLPTLYDGDYVSTWKVMEEFKADGRARSIGVSNFQVDHLKKLAAETDTVPAVNQIELHPYLLNEEVRSYGESQGIATEAWSPIAQGGVLDDEVITSTLPLSAARPHRSCSAGTSSATRSCSRSRTRRSGSRRTSRCSTSSSTTTRCRRFRGSTAARTAAPGRTRTRSTSA